METSAKVDQVKEKLTSRLHFINLMILHIHYMTESNNIHYPLTCLVK